MKDWVPSIDSLRHHRHLLFHMITMTLDLCTLLYTPFPVTLVCAMMGSEHVSHEKNGSERVMVHARHRLRKGEQEP